MNITEKDLERVISNEFIFIFDTQIAYDENVLSFLSDVCNYSVMLNIIESKASIYRQPQYIEMYANELSNELIAYLDSQFQAATVYPENRIKQFYIGKVSDTTYGMALYQYLKSKNFFTKVTNRIINQMVKLK